MDRRNVLDPILMLPLSRIAIKRQVVVVLRKISMILDTELLQDVEDQIISDARLIVARLRHHFARKSNSQAEPDLSDELQPVEPVPGRVLTDAEIDGLDIRRRGWYLFAARGSVIVGAEKIRVPLGHPDLLMHVGESSRRLTDAHIGVEDKAGDRIFAAEHYNGRLMHWQSVFRFMRSATK